ncbi:hypothetical protein QSG84_00180 [Acinetobacter sp. SAAs470]|nr:MULTISPECIES: hypothetical protein [unclassified Acinetobacter]WOE33211.1 hypothetical protein QSG84_00180 [Acinetobacter sp. SAAs470]WOE39871.1 hypothetical protein QSG86_09225 [Acinetobacter sp. SAAs474]
MLSLEQYAVDPVAIQTGIAQIKKRSRQLDILAICTLTLFIVSVMGLYLQQDLIYGFFGLTTEVKQLHVPLSAATVLNGLNQTPDYFMTLLRWFGWFIFKLFTAFLAAFFLIRFFKRFNFFAHRFKSFVLKTVGWLIAFIVVWSGLTLLQDHNNRQKNDTYQNMIRYDQRIEQSEMAQFLSNSDLNTTIQAYLLAQTALLHQPADKNSAIPYVLTLVKAEKNDAKFIEYGFQPAQLWTMQYQLYGRPLTALAHSVDQQASQAIQLSQWLKILIWIIMISSAVLTLILFLLARNLKQRVMRIEHKISLL